MENKLFVVQGNHSLSVVSAENEEHAITEVLKFFYFYSYPPDKERAESHRGDYTATELTPRSEPGMISYLRA